MHARVKNLVDRGQIEFVNGGWCMADDASPSLDAEIDQVTLGHRYVWDTLGVVPKYAWHIGDASLPAIHPLLYLEPCNLFSLPRSIRSLTCNANANP